MLRTLFKPLGGGYMKRLMSTSIDSSEVSSFMKMILKHTSAGKSLETMRPPRYYEALESFESAVKLADQLLEQNHLSLPTEHKQVLSNVYSQYALAINNYGTYHLPLAKEAIQKSIKLNPENEMAKSLFIDLNFDAIAEPFRPK